MDELTLQQSHAAAFAFFGGVPHSVLYDNPKTVTTGRDEQSEPIWKFKPSEVGLFTPSLTA